MAVVDRGVGDMWARVLVGEGVECVDIIVRLWSFYGGRSHSALARRSGDEIIRVRRLYLALGM